MNGCGRVADSGRETGPVESPGWRCDCYIITSFVVALLAIASVSTGATGLIDPESMSIDPTISIILLVSGAILGIALVVALLYKTTCGGGNQNERQKRDIDDLCRGLATSRGVFRDCHVNHTGRGMRNEVMGTPFQMTRQNSVEVSRAISHAIDNYSLQGIAIFAHWNGTIRDENDGITIQLVRIVKE